MGLQAMEAKVGFFDTKEEERKEGSKHFHFLFLFFSVFPSKNVTFNGWGPSAP